MSDPSWKPTVDDLTGATDLDSDANGLDTAIDAATDVVKEIESADSSLDDGRLKRITIYLAAHIATVPNPQKQKQGGASFSATFLRETDYGGTAAMLDPTGVLGDGEAEESMFSPRVRGGSGW